MTQVVEFPGLGLSFTVDRIAFTIQGFSVYWYGVIIAAGFLLALIYAYFNAPKMNIDLNRLFDAVIAGTIGSIICARLYYVIFFDGAKYWEDPIQILRIHDGGVAIYGAVIGAMVFGGATAKLRGLKAFAALDLAAIGFLIGQALGRWGNFINQEAFGTVTTLPWGMRSENTGFETVHPCFLYESLLCLLGFVLLHFFNRKLRRYDGQTFLLYIIWYGFSRFFIEGLRTDSLIIPYTSLRVSQVLAAACVLVGCFLLFLFRHRTSLTGCGSRKIMEAVGLSHTGAEADPELAKSTIFESLPPEEEEIPDGDAAEEEEEEVSGEATAEEASEEEAVEEAQPEETPEENERASAEEAPEPEEAEADPAEEESTAEEAAEAEEPAETEEGSSAEKPSEEEADPETEGSEEEN